MRIQYCSDLHLEFPANQRYVQKNPLIPSGEILVLAGDIMPFAEPNSYNDFVDRVSDQFEAVYWIPGNHEYYGSTLSGSSPRGCSSSEAVSSGPSIGMAPTISLFEKIRSNFFLVNNHSVIYKDAIFLFSTLWSSITPQHEWEIRRSVADYRAIKVDDRNLLPAEVNDFHDQCRSFLENALRENVLSEESALPKPIASPESAKTPTLKKIVVTHHVPTLLNYPPYYKKSLLTEAFAVELYDFIEKSGVDFWIYGHHHMNVENFRIGQTELRTNQLGYVKYGEQRKFRRDAVIAWD